MKQITVTLNIDEAVLNAAERLGYDLTDAINRELGWLHDSGMVAESWSFTDQPLEEKTPKVFILCEEFENEDAIREFSIHGVSEDKNFLRDQMENLIKADAYGFIANKGVSEHSEDRFSTNFDCGFVEYYILEQEVLSRDNRNRAENAKTPLDEQIAKATPATAALHTNGQDQNREQGRE